MKPNPMWMLLILITTSVLTLFLIGVQIYRQNLASPWLSAMAVQIKQAQNQNQIFETCLFGDSITAPLGDSFGDTVANLAVGGLSTDTLLTQLQRLKESGIKCNQAIVAIGTNDACYGISDHDFIVNYRQIIAQLRSLGANKIQLIPAFYSTVAASHKPNFAGPIERVDEINQLIDEVARIENVVLIDSGLEALYKNHSLRSELTSDGVHLNSKGRAIYREFLIKILGQA